MRDSRENFKRFIFFLFIIVLMNCFNSYKKYIFAQNNLNKGYVKPSLLEIHTAEFAIDRYSTMAYDPFIKLRVFNNSTERISGAILSFKLVSDKREIFSGKMIKYPQDYLQPGQADVWLVYPRAETLKTIRNIPQNTQLIVEVEKAFCPKRNSPWQPEYDIKIPQKRDYYK